MDMSKTILGWYFTDRNERLRYGDGRKIKVGITHEVEHEPALCKSGLHASKTVLAALNFATGPILYRVQVGGKIKSDADKMCGTSRKYLARIDAEQMEQMLHLFARQCALDVAHLWDCPPIVRDYLETGDEEMRSGAATSAYAVATSAYAAYDPVYAAAPRAAAAAAAYTAAHQAAYTAAHQAAYTAYDAGDTYSAARGKIEKRLEKMALKAIKLAHYTSADGTAD
jgi:hypothetical protein